MRIKSKDIHFVQSIFYLANKKNIDTSFILSLSENYSNALFIFFAFKVKRACKYPTASS